MRFGIDNFTVHMPQKGWSFDASGSLLQPGYYKLNLALKKPDLGFVDFDLYQFDTYDDGSLDVSTPSRPSSTSAAGTSSTRAATWA